MFTDDGDCSAGDVVASAASCEAVKSTQKMLKSSPSCLCARRPWTDAMKLIVNALFRSLCRVAFLL